jgi:hypothetical protein
MYYTLQRVLGAVHVQSATDVECHFVLCAAHRCGAGARRGLETEAAEDDVAQRSRDAIQSRRVLQPRCGTSA